MSDPSQNTSISPGTNGPLTTLPHSGLQVPDPTVRVTRLTQRSTFDGVAFRAVLRHGNTQIGVISNDGDGARTEFQPLWPDIFGYPEINAFAAACRDGGDEVFSTESVLNDLVEEYDTARIVADSARRGRITVRLRSPMFDGATKRYTAEIASMKVPSAEPRHHAQIAAAAATIRPATAGETWQVWTGDTWQDLPGRVTGCP